MAQSASNEVTRVARRRAYPGHERAFEEAVRAMFARMREHAGFLHGDVVPPELPGGKHIVVVHFASRAQLDAWDASPDRDEAYAALAEHAEGELPELRQLDVMEDWAFGALRPPGTRPPRWKTAMVTWLGIWPLASLAIWLLTPIWQGLGLPFLLITAINVTLIVGSMTYLVAPLLTRLLKPFLVPRRRG